MAQPATLNLTYYEGDDETYLFTFQLADASPVDLTGAIVECEIRDNPGGALMATAVCTVTDAVNGEVKVELSKTDTRAMAGVRLRYDLQITSGGKTRTYLVGDMTGAKEVTV